MTALPRGDAEDCLRDVGLGGLSAEMRRVIDAVLTVPENVRVRNAESVVQRHRETLGIGGKPRAESRLAAKAADDEDACLGRQTADGGRQQKQCEEQQAKSAHASPRTLRQPHSAESNATKKRKFTG